MPVYLYKTLSRLFYPLPLGMLLLISGAIIIYRYKRSGISLIVTGILVIWISAMPAVSSSLTAFFERQYLPVHPDKLPKGDAIVVVGSAAGSAKTPWFDIDLIGSSDRVRYAAKLYQAGKADAVIASGGGRNRLTSGNSEASRMIVLLKEWGVPAKAILAETDSLNTYQNATNTKKILDQKGWTKILLVTSAIHMPRALRTYRSNGIHAIPAPTDFQVLETGHFTLQDFLPNAGSLSTTTYAFKELLGILYYRKRGWIE